MAADKPKPFFLCLLLLVILTSLSAVSPGIPEASEVMRNVFEACGKIDEMEYILIKRERFGQKMVSQKSHSKVHYNPFKFYSEDAEKTDGMELLYVTGENNNKALINPNGFPWINLSLDPYGSLMRREQHHLLLDAGYAKLIPILEHALGKAADKPNVVLKNRGEVRHQNWTCWKISVEISDFAWNAYTVNAGENFEKTVKDRKLSEYRIVEKNAQLSDLVDARAGETYQLPTAYAPRFELWVDQQLNVPVFFKVFDEDGVYEEFEYVELDIAPQFKPDEFSKDFEEYNF